MARIMYRTASGEQVVEEGVQDIVIVEDVAPRELTRVFVNELGRPESPVIVSASIVKSHHCHFTEIERAVVGRLANSVVHAVEGDETRIDGWKRRGSSRWGGR